VNNSQQVMTGAGVIYQCLRRKGAIRIPVSEYVRENGLHFGIHQYLNEDDLHYISDTLRGHFK